ARVSVWGAAAGPVLGDLAPAHDAPAVGAALDAGQRRLDAQQGVALGFAHAGQDLSGGDGLGGALPVGFALGEQLVLVGQRLPPALQQRRSSLQQRASEFLHRLIVHVLRTKHDGCHRFDAEWSAAPRRSCAGTPAARKDFVHRARRASRIAMIAVLTSAPLRDSGQSPRHSSSDPPAVISVPFSHHADRPAAPHASSAKSSASSNQSTPTILMPTSPSSARPARIVVLYGIFVLSRQGPTKPT